MLQRLLCSANKKQDWYHWWTNEAKHQLSLMTHDYMALKLLDMSDIYIYQIAELQGRYTCIEKLNCLAIVYIPTMTCSSWIVDGVLRTSTLRKTRNVAVGYLMARIVMKCLDKSSQARSTDDCYLGISESSRNHITQIVVSTSNLLCSCKVLNETVHIVWCFTQ